PRIGSYGWGWNQSGLQDQAGEWWLPTGAGLYRFPCVKRLTQLARTPPKAVYTTHDGLPSNDIFRLYQDSRGDIWISTFSPGPGGLTRWERATETLHPYTEADGLPAPGPPPPSFAEAGGAPLWIGTNGGLLLPPRAGRLSAFGARDGVPAGWLR